MLAAREVLVADFDVSVRPDASHDAGVVPGEQRGRADGRRLGEDRPADRVTVARVIHARLVDTVTARLSVAKRTRKPNGNSADLCVRLRRHRSRFG